MMLLPLPVVLLLLAVPVTSALRKVEDIRKDVMEFGGQLRSELTSDKVADVDSQGKVDSAQLVDSMKTLKEAIETSPPFTTLKPRLVTKFNRLLDLYHDAKDLNDPNFMMEVDAQLKYLMKDLEPYYTLLGMDLPHNNPYKEEVPQVNDLPNPMRTYAEMQNGGMGVMRQAGVGQGVGGMSTVGGGGDAPIGKKRSQRVKGRRRSGRGRSHRRRSKSRSRGHGARRSRARRY